jgi:hypothetical protein
MRKHLATLFVLTISLQYRENYGSHAWEGEGECPQYWKNKGGSEVVISKSLTVAEAQDHSHLEQLVEDHRSHLENSSEYSSEHMFNWQIETKREWVKRHLDEQKSYKSMGIGSYTWPKTFNEVLEDQEKSRIQIEKWKAEQAS